MPKLTRPGLLFALFVATAGGCVGDIGDGSESDFGEWTWEDDETGDDDGAGSLSAGGANKSVAIATGPTTDAERTKFLPVARSSSGADRRVVMRLEPSDLPKLRRGDHLMIPAEVEVTTRCDIGQVAPGCNYSPNVAAQIILTGTKNDTKAQGVGSKALTPVQQMSCSKNEHHCMFIFRPGDAEVVLKNGFELPCVANNTCYVNLVMWAFHPDARSGGQDKVIVGQNEGNFLVNGKSSLDAGRIMAIRERAVTGEDRRRRETSGGGNKSIPTNTNPVVVYSHKLKKGDLRAGEQFVVEANIVARTGGRARFSTQLILAKNPNATSGSLAKITPGQISEHNGKNCTGGTCQTRKVSAFRVTDDIQGPVYVNVVVKSAVPGGGSTSVVVDRNAGWVRSTRYRSALNARN